MVVVATTEQAGRIARLVRRYMTLESLGVVVLLGGALMLRLFLSQVRGLAGDVQSYVDWGNTLDHHFLNLYTLRPDDNYPPLGAYLFGVWNKLYVLLMHLRGVRSPSFDVSSSRVLAVYMRLPFVISDIGLTAGIYLLARRVAPIGRAFALAALFAFAPGVILDGTLWGQTDGLMALLLFLSAFFALNCKPAWSGVMLGCGIILKLFPAMYAPLLFVYLWKAVGRRHAGVFAGAVAATALVLCLPFLLPPHPQILVMIANYRVVVGPFPVASVSAYNLWWMLGLQHVNAFAPLAGPLSVATLGSLMFIFVVAVTIAGIWRDPSPVSLFLGMGITAVGYFDLTTYQHERYIYPAIVMFLAAAIYNRRHLIWFVVSSVTMFLNLATVIVWNAGYTRPPVDVSRINAYLDAHPGLYSAIAVLNVCLLFTTIADFSQGAWRRTDGRSRRIAIAEGDLRAAWLPAAATLGDTPAPTPLGTVNDVLQPSAQSPAGGPLTRRGLSVVLPAYNEEAVIEATVRRCVATLATLAPDFEVIVVDDGSRDRTGAIVDRLTAEDPRVRALHNRPNRGYGGALIAGFDAAQKSLTFFMDADGQFDIADIARLLTLREQGYRAVLGYRQRRRDAFLRKVNALGWNRLGRLLFGLRIRDVDCAFKLYDTNLVRALDVHAEGAMINTEMLVKLQKLGVPYAEVAVGHYPRTHGKATGANPRVIARAFRELLRLRGKLKHWHAHLPQEDPVVQTL